MLGISISVLTSYRGEISCGESPLSFTCMQATVNYCSHLPLRLASHNWTLQRRALLRSGPEWLGTKMVLNLNDSKNVSFGWIKRAAHTRSHKRHLYCRERPSVHTGSQECWNNDGLKL